MSLANCFKPHRVGFKSDPMGFRIIQNGFNHLLQHNLPHRYRIVLWIDQMYKMKSIEMDNPNPLKHLGADLNPPLGVVSYNLKWFQPFTATQSFSP